MGIGFLSPLFLIGLALVAVPVLLHLRRRHQSRIERFPSLFFLRQVRQASVRRRRIRHWLLLALRVAALAALALAFARPLWRGGAAAAAAAADGRELVILVDDSWSMGLENRFARAVEAAVSRVEAMGAADVATLIVFSDRARVELESSADRAALLQALQSLDLEPRGTRYAPALKLARRAVLDSRQPRTEVVLISDLQRVGWERGEDLRLPAGAEVTLVDLSGADPAPSNLAVAGAVLERSLEGDRERISAQARVTRRGGEGPATATVTLEIGGRELGRTSVRLEPEASELVTFEPFSLPQGITRGRIALDGDGLATDNEFFFVLSRAQALPVLLLEERRAGGRSGSGLYVEQALRLGRDPRLEVDRRSPSALGSADLEHTAVVVASDVALDAGAVRRLRTFVEEGGGLLVALGPRSEGTVAALAEAGLGPAPRRSQSGDPGQRIARIVTVERSHPRLEPFAAPRSGDFGSARFFRHLKLVPGEEDRVLARFDDGDPALVELPVGKGRVVMWTSTFDTYWNDFALQPIFLPFLHHVTKSLAGFRPPAPWLTVGAVVERASLPGLGETAVGAVTVVGPDGAEHAFAEVLELSGQGFYSVVVDGSEVGALAANVDLRESDLAAVDVEELRAALVPGGGAASPGDEQETQRSPAEREASQGLWRYLVLLLLALLVAELFVANRWSPAGG